MTSGLLILALFAAAFAMAGQRLSRSVITAPMAFLGLGYLLSTTGILPGDDMEAALHLVAEVTIVILLFLDASQTDLDALKRRHVWPQRMLLIGMPLMLLLGTLAAYPFLPGWPLVAVALVAALLAPTDAALGQSVVSNTLVPIRVRRALTVESGLNDGLALPAVLLFASLTAEAMEAEQTSWLVFAAKQLLLGPAAGAVIGIVGGTLLLAAVRRNWTSETFEGVGALALAGSAYLAATLIDGNGFIAAFVAGLCFGNAIKGQCGFIYEFTESEGQLLTWGTFFLLGLALLPEALQHLDAAMLAIILISLFVVRPLAIWLSLLGSDASPVTRVFFGWFGPRGLATALFALLIVDQIDHTLAEPMLALAINAVWISALLHGISAAPAAKWYAGKVERMGDCPETMDIDGPARPIPQSEAGKPTLDSGKRGGGEE